jgi:large subunit ribosomal protein L9
MKLKSSSRTTSSASAVNPTRSASPPVTRATICSRNGFAVPLTQSNKRQIEALRQRRAEREAHEFNTMTELAKGVSKFICVIKVKAGEDGKMFGSVTAGMIADELKHQFDITLDKRKIHLEHPLKTLGEREVELHLHAEVKGTLKVRVESLTPASPHTRRRPRPLPKRRLKSPGPKSAVMQTRCRRLKAEKAEAAGEKKPHAAKAEKPAKAPSLPKAEKKEKAE